MKHSLWEYTSVALPESGGGEKMSLGQKGEDLPYDGGKSVSREKSQ
jgi:hypothetical protein